MRGDALPNGPGTPNGLSIDSLLPPAMAAKAEEIGVEKAKSGFTKTFALSVLA